MLSCFIYFDGQMHELAGYTLIKLFSMSTCTTTDRDSGCRCAKILPEYLLVSVDRLDGPLNDNAKYIFLFELTYKLRTRPTGGMLNFELWFNVGKMCNQEQIQDFS